MANGVAQTQPSLEHVPEAAAPTRGRFNRVRESDRLQTVLWPTILIIVTLGIWEILSRTGTVDEIMLPAPSAIASAMWRLCGESYFWDATWVTAQEALIGFGAGVVAAWILGTLIGFSRIFSLAFYPIIIAFQITPRVALAPLFLTWFGFGISSKIVMAATICFFPILVNVVLGLESVNKETRALMRSFGASKWEEYRKLTIYASLPAIFAGLKVGITLALIGAVVGEFVGGTEGLGVLIKTFNFQLLIAEGFAAILALSIMGLVLYGITVLLESRIVFWQGRH